MMRSCLASVCFALLTANALAEIDFASLLFSTDGGTTWHEDYPLLTGTNRTFALKVEWTGHDDREMVWSGLVGCRVSATNDFASSEGRVWGSPLFWQTDDAHYLKYSAQYLNKTPKPYYFHVDLGPRREGERRHPKTEKPFPACPAYRPGTWYFTCHLSYHLEKPLKRSLHKDKRLIEATRRFFVYIDDPDNSILE